MYAYLIIDDEPLIRKGTIKKLSPLNDIITCCGEADNGVTGIELIKEFHPDIFILDMQMPIMDGMQLLPYLSSNFPDIALIVISGYQNFDYMKQAITSKAIDYILKPFSREEIQNVVLSTIDFLQNKQQLKNQFTLAQEEKEAALYDLDITLLENLILGYETSSQQILSQRLSFITQAHNYIVFTLYSHKDTISKTQFQQWLDDNNYHDLALFLPHPSIQQLGVIMLLVPDTRQARTDFIRIFIQHLISDLEIQKKAVNIGISNSYSDFSQLHKAYLDTTTALDSQKLSLNETINCFYLSNTPLTINIEWEMKDEFLFRMESGDTEKVRIMAEQLFNYYTSIPNCSLSDAKRHCTLISSECRSILNYYLNQQEGSHEVSTNMQSIVNTIFSLSDLKEYYLQFFLNITNMVKTKSVYRDNDLIEQIKIYISRNYYKNLTQEFVASLFYLNRSYLSQMFKKKTGENFVDFLNNIRIEKSKDLLVNTDKKMYSIAKAVGYDNTKYFFRIFKKKTGITPEQYRLQYKK